MKYCPDCTKTKPLTEFYIRKKFRWESEKYQGYCKICTSKKRRDWYYKKGGREKVLEKAKEWRKNNPEKDRERRRKWNWNSKIKALNAYGGKCSCCLETEPKFLAIDHVNNDGNKHRKKIKNQTIYVWLRERDYPSGFQVLCHNCNMAKAFWKICPHKENK